MKVYTESLNRAKFTIERAQIWNCTNGRGTSAESTGKYFKEAQLNGRNVKAFIDTGSSECTVTASTVLMCDLLVVKETMQLWSFGLQEFKVTSLGYVRGQLIIERVKVDDVQVRIVPDDCQPVPMIIGRSVTEQPHVKYTKETDTFKFQYVQDDIMYVDVNTTDSVTVLSDIELTPGTMNFISVRFKERLFITHSKFIEDTAKLAKEKSNSEGEELTTLPPIMLTKRSV